MIAVSARAVCKRYGGTVALDAVDLEVPEGRICGVFGTNGAGKSTLLQAIAGMIPVGGTIRVLGLDPWRERERLLQSMAFTADVTTLPRWIRVAQLLDFVAAVHPAFVRRHAEELIQQSGIRASDRPASLSKGLAAQLQLAVAMAIRARVVVLDEPTLGLDALSRTRFFDMLIERLAAGPMTILVASHEAEEMEHVVTDLVLMHRGRIVLHCTAEEYGARYVEVHVHPEHLDIAREMGPIYERPAMAGRKLLFDGVDRRRLGLFGDLHRPAIATVFSALTSRAPTPGW